MLNVLMKRAFCVTAGVFLVASVSLGGCSLSRQVPQERYDRALKLVDDGTARLRERKLSEAKAAFSMATDLAPLPSAVDGEGCVALLEGDFSRAEDRFSKARSMDSSYHQATANLALLKDLMGKHDEARELYNEYLSRVPEAAGVRNNRAALEYDRGGDRMWVVRELEKAGMVSDHEVIAHNVAIVRGEMSGGVDGKISALPVHDPKVTGSSSREQPSSGEIEDFKVR